MTTTLRSADRDATASASGPRRRLDPIACLVVLATVAFALISIGPPLVGAGTFSGVDLLGAVSPQRDEAMAGVSAETINLGDTVDFALPNATFFGEELRKGNYAAWNPHVLGGVPLAATPNFGVLSPVTVPFWVLPGWLAPAYMKLLELAVAAGGSYLFLRRVRLGAAAAWLGGLAFASSGFVVVWTNWPQSRVAVFVPVLFWALERLVQQHRARDVALVALPVAAMILSGFPSIAGYAVLTGGCYLLVRALAEHRGDRGRAVGVLAAGGAGVLAGAALVAFWLVPWVHTMSNTVIRGRAQGPQDHIPAEMLLTAVAPYLFGTVNPGDPPLWFHDRIFLEYSFFVGGAVLVLALVAVAAARRGRSLLPGGLWLFLVGASVAWAALIFSGGRPLAVLQQLPVLFSDNFVGRGRSVLGFLIAALAAVGFQLVLDRWRARPPGGASGWPARAYGLGVWLLPALAGAWLLAAAMRVAGGRHADHLTSELLTGLGFVAASVACVAWLWWGSPARSRAHALAAGLIPVLVVVQALMLTVPYHPRTDREHFYPRTEAAAFLQQNLGHERYNGADGAILGGIDVPLRLRALHGHIFPDRRFAELLETMPGQQFDTPATYLNGPALDGDIVRHPVLDRVSVSHYQISPEHPPLGEQAVDAGDGTSFTLSPGHRSTVELTAPGPLRGVGVLPGESIPAGIDSRLAVTVSDGSGRTVAEADRIVRRTERDSPFWVPLAAESVTAGNRLEVHVEVVGPVAIPVAGRGGRPAVSVVTAVDDGLRLAYDDSSVIYERTRALPRARWASRTVVEPESTRRLDLLSSGALPADTAVLDTAGAPATGEAARVRWLRDGTDRMTLSVDADGAGYLVIADAIQTSWSVTVGGERAELVPADHGLAAVPVPAGRHVVELALSPPYYAAGGWISGVTALMLLLGIAWPRPRRLRG